MRRGDALSAVAYALLVALVALLAGPFWLFLFTSAIITAVVAMSVGMIYDNAGLLSLCQMTFAGIGAWTVGWLNQKTDLPYLVMLPVAAVAAFLVGLAVGLPALRLRGQNLAVFTLIFSAAFASVIFADGFPGLIEANRVSPPTFADGDVAFFVFCAVVLGMLAVAVTALRRARVGRWWYSVRRSERATAAMGRSVALTKLTAFAASAAVAGVGGALLVALNGIVSGASFQPIESMTILTSALMFGAGNFEGALAVGLAGRLIPNLLSDLGLPQDIAPLIFAVGGVLALSNGEGGLSGAIRAVVAGQRAGRRNAIDVHRDCDLDAGDESGLLGTTRRPGDRSHVGSGIEAVLSVDGATVNYGAIRALDDVSFEMLRGQLVGLIGPNGAGKSTLVDLITGFIPSQHGRIVLQGADISSLSPRRRAQLGLRRSFQQGHTPEDLTIGAYLDLAAKGSKVDIGAAIAHFSLPSADMPIALLDVGSRRILEVCGAVVSQPVVVVLDEPAAGLSGHQREEFVAALAAIPSAMGISMLLIEHDLAVVASLCDSVIVLDFGAVIASGPSEQVLQDEAVVAAYIGAAV
jgi:branched-chain amino acid transport system permease protein